MIGDRVFEMGPVPHYAAEIVSMEKKGDFYTVTVSDGNGHLFKKRVKVGKMIAIRQEAPQKLVEPKYHPVERLRINDPNVLHILSYFEGADWVHKQHSYPNCQKCVFANKQAWEVLSSLGPKAKGLTVAMLLDGGGRIEGAKHTEHWYQVDEDGNVNIEEDTVSDSTRRAMREVGIESV
jgi:hypothetical protein